MNRRNIKIGSGFTLIELLITMVIVAILAALVVPSYRNYLITSKLSEAFDSLVSYRVRMEQSYQDNNNYGASNCSVTNPIGKYFTYNCQISSNGQGFTATATGKSTEGLGGYSFTIDETGTRVTTQFPTATVPANCWLTHLGGC